MSSIELQIHELEAKLSEMHNVAGVPNRSRAYDESFQKGIVVGFDPEISLEHRLVATQAVMESNFPKG